MAMKRIMGTETEYGIVGGDAHAVVRAYQGRKASHENFQSTNQSAVPGFTDIGGHVGGDYGSVEDQLSELYGEGYYPQSSQHSIPRISYQPPGYSIPDDIIDNGSRFYVDMGHPEMSIAETSNPRDAVIWDKAGELIVLGSAKRAGQIKIYKNNCDGKGTSYGCHENYLLKRISPKKFEEGLTKALLPFFITRQIYCGTGKVGIESPSSYSGVYYYGKAVKTDPYKEQMDKAKQAISDLERYFLDTPDFKEVAKVLARFAKIREDSGEQEVYQLSQRADFMESVIGLQTTQNRPIMNTRDEPHANRDKYMRLHVICGDANMSEVAHYLKMGTTSLVLDLIEDKLAPNIEVVKPVRQVQRISWDLQRKWPVEISGNKTISAVDIQRLYLKAAQDAYTGKDKLTDDILGRWEHTLDTLERDPMELSGTIDWVIKLNLLTHLMDKHGVGMNDQVIKNAALQYHDVDREASLFYYLQKAGAVERIVTDEEIAFAVLNPPSDTRAYLRAKVGGLKAVDDVDWGGFRIRVGDERKQIDLDEPFAGTEEQVGALVNNYPGPKQFVKALEAIDGIKVSTYTPRVYTQSRIIQYQYGKRPKNKNRRFW